MDDDDDQDKKFLTFQDLERISRLSPEELKKLAATEYRFSPGRIIEAIAVTVVSTLLSTAIIFWLQSSGYF